MRTILCNIRIDVDLSKEEILQDTDIKDHIVRQIKATGDRHPEDPLFGSIKKVALHGFKIMPTAAEAQKSRERKAAKKLREICL